MTSKLPRKPFKAPQASSGANDPANESNEPESAPESSGDPTEAYRRARVRELGTEATDNRAELESRHGRIWTTDELRQDFEVLGFLAPFVIVREKATGRKGSLEFQHSPRYYFSFQLDLR